MDAKDYTVRCDKCQFKPYVYCEMCMVRTKLQHAIETNREEMRRSCESMQLCVTVIHEMLDKQKEQIKDLYKRLLGEHHG